MKMTYETKTTYWLPLTEKEHSYLSKLIMDPNGDNMEDTDNKKIRSNLWHRLNPDDCDRDVEVY